MKNVCMCLKVNTYMCVCVCVSNVCMQITIQQTDCGIQATDSLNLLKPQIVLSLF